MSLSVIILAAGQGKRMFSDLPKVLQPLAGKPLLEHVITTATSLEADNIYVVYGHEGNQVLSYFGNRNEIHWVLQEEQLGTGHAVLQVLPFLENAHEQILILIGDAPLISVDTLRQLIQSTKKDAIGLLTATLQSPAGFGRVVRDKKGNPCSIVEEKDASKKQKMICEINTGIWLLPAKLLQQWVPKLKNQNEQKEYYLTDIFKMAIAKKVPVNTVMVSSETEVLGVNDHLQLAHLERAYQRQQAEKYLLAGLTLMDINRFDIRGELQFGRDVVIDNNVLIEGNVEVGNHCYIGPNVILKNVKIGDHVRIEANSIVDSSEIHNECIIGPYARIRPGSMIHRKAHVGNFVELKKTELGENSKANHLTYLGDTIVGKNVNVGAGTITCNYDGVNKFKTTIEDDAFIGSNTALVAPVTVGKGATIGAGSVITQKAPEEKLTIARARQTTIANWERPKKKDKLHE